MSINEILFKGSEHHFKGELDKAVQTFNQALNIEPDNAYARCQIGWIYVKKRMFSEAIKEFEKVRSKNPDNTFCRKWLGLLYMHFEEMEKALTIFKEAISIDPENADIFYFTGVLYTIQHDPDKALEMLKKSKEADLKAEADTYFRLADAFHSNNMLKSAEAEYNNALNLNPKYTKALNELGWIYFDREEYNQTIETWEKSFNINPKDNETKCNLTHIYNFLARKYLKEGNKLKAIAQWKKALSYFNKNYEANYYIKKYGNGV